MRGDRGLAARFVGAAIVLSMCVTGCGATAPADPPITEVMPIDPGPLSHAQAVAYAARCTPDAATLRARLDSARAAFDVATQLENPKLSAGWEDFGLEHSVPWTMVQQTYATTVSLSSWLSQPRRNAAARADLDAETAALAAEASQLVAVVFDAYDDAVAARAEAALADRALAAADRELADVDRLVGAGIEARFEHDRAAAQLATVRSIQAQARAAARAANLALAFAIGCERPTELVLSEGLSGDVDAAALDAETLVGTARLQRPELVAATAHCTAEAERLDLASSRFQFLPDVMFGVRRQSDDTRGVAGLDGVAPIFDAGGNEIAVRDAALREARVALARIDRSIVTEVHRTADGHASARALRDEAAPARADACRRARAGAERLFAAGEIRYVELAQAQRDELEAERATLTAQHDAARAFTALQRAVGTWAVEGRLGLALDAPTAETERSIGSPEP